MKFSEWLAKELAERKMSQADLSRLSGITTAQISRIITGDRNPGESTLIGVAKAFNLPPELVFEKAGILPPVSDKDISPLRRRLLQLSEDLPNSDIELAIKILEAHADFYAKNPQARPER